MVEVTIVNTPYGKVYRSPHMDVKVDEEFLMVMFIPRIEGDEERKAKGIQSFTLEERTGMYPRVYTMHNEDGEVFELRIHNPEGLHEMKTKLEFKKVEKNVREKRAN